MDEERERLVRRATDLGTFLLGDEICARAGALAAVRLLGHETEQQRRRIRHRAEAPRRRLILNQEQLVQVTVYALADEPGNPPYQNRYIGYLKFIAHACLLGSSFDACILVNRFIYALSLDDVLKFYEFLTYGEDTKEKRVALAKQEQFFDLLRKRFPELLRETCLNKEYQFVADPFIDTSRIKGYLVHLAPWNACCRLPTDFDDSQRVEDLHGRGSRRIIRSAKEESTFEVNRVYALLDPVTHEKICAALHLPFKLKIPSFQRT